MPAESPPVEELLLRLGSTQHQRGSHSSRIAFSKALVGLDEYIGNPAWTDGKDVIGSAFQRAISGSDRRRLGQFITPIRVGRVMARWLLEREPEVLFDPGCGSGSLLIAATHEGVGQSRLIGVDVDPLAVEMAKCNVQIRSMSNVEIRLSDFLFEDPPDRPDAIICNPPYTRHHDIDATRKSAIHRGITERLGLDLHRTASLHVLFLVRAIEISAPEARLAFITPSNWLDKSYAAAVKRFVLDEAHVKSIINLPVRELIFDRAITTASITLIEKGAKRRSTRIVQSPSSKRSELHKAVNSGGAQFVLKSEDKWSRPTTKQVFSGVRLSELANVHRGIATGCNAFFVLSEKRRRELSIALCSVRPCLASPKQLASPVVTEATLRALPNDARRWLFTPSKVRTRGPIADYLSSGLDDYGVLTRTLVRQREQAGRKWYQLPTDVPAPIVVTYINQGDARFVRNDASAIPLNNWLRIVPKPGVDVDKLLFELTRPEVSREIRSRGREYGNGMWKLEPSDLLGVHVLNLDI